MSMSASAGAQTSPDLVARARSGDSQAFAALVVEHGPDVLRLCMLITADITLAEDAAQNAWGQVWRHISSIRNPSSFRPWVLKVAANEAKQQLRRQRRRATNSLTAEMEAPERSDIEEMIALRSALKTLSVDDRELLALRYELGLTSAEIGHIVNISAEAVRTRLMRIRSRLQQELDDDA